MRRELLRERIILPRVQILPPKKYNIIYADPPWEFSSKQGFSTKKGMEVCQFIPLAQHYQTQSKEWIKTLPVSQIAAENAALFLWSTDAHIKEAIEVMECWGFKYTTVAFIWEKKTIKGKTYSNVAPWTMKNFEQCLLGTRGRMQQYKQCHNIKQQVKALRTKHSKKPHAVRKRIVELFGDLPRIELFARNQYPGWDCWGNEV